MAGDEKGLAEAHTRRAGRRTAAGGAAAELGAAGDDGGAAPGEPGAEGRGQARRDELAESVARIAAELDAGAEQLDLLAGSPDLDPVDVLGRVAETVATSRRGRGRPAGAANRRNTAVFDYLEALGHRCPAVTLSLIQSADTMALARALGHADWEPALDEHGQPEVDDLGRPLRRRVIVPADPVKILAVQAQAARELIQYKFAKRRELDVRVEKLHLFLAGDLGEAEAARAAPALSIFGENVQDQAVSAGERVRQPVVSREHDASD